jgi:hypothetical protein
MVTGFSLTVILFMNLGKFPKGITVSVVQIWVTFPFPAILVYSNNTI